MFIKTISITIILYLINCGLANSQINLHQYKVESLHYHYHNEYAVEKNNIQNEIDLIANLLYVGYKRFISSQDASNCVFTPSCSTYALITISKNGLIRGALDTFDRLTRCNGLSASSYVVDPETNLLYDPVE